MTRRSVRVRYVARVEWTELVDVDVPDTVTADQLDEIVDSAIAKSASTPDIIDDEDVSVDDWSWIGAAPATLPPPGPAEIPVPDDAWVTWGGSRWASDGRMIVREDMIPRITSWCEGGGSWRLYPAADVSRLLDAAIAGPRQSGVVHCGIFDSCFAGLLPMGVVFASSPQHPGIAARDPLIPAALFVDGQLVAVIQPRAVGPGIRADGTPVTPREQP